MAAFSGIDWASEHHDVCVEDGGGELIAVRRFAHDERGLRALTGLLVDERVELVGIERPEGLLVDRLLAAGLAVMPIHPNRLAAARDRYRAAAGKSDRFDAMVACELARTDSHRFRVLRPLSDETLALRTLVRSREDLVGARVALANQLRAHLDAFWPGAMRIFADVDSSIGLAFLTRYPSPADAERLGVKRLERFLGRNAYCGRRSPEELLGRLRSAPRSAVGGLEAESRRGAVLGLCAALEPVVAQIGLLGGEIAAALDRHPDGPIFRSLFRDRRSVICAAGLLAEIGDDRGRYPSPDALAADAGQCPVAHESGKLRRAGFRWACDKRLRNHLGVLADSTRHWHPWAHRTYARARARGADHPHAIRVLGRAWCRVIWRCWQDRMPYDPERHRGLQKLTSTVGG